MDDYTLPWEEHSRDPRDPMQPSHEISLSQVRKSAMALANLLDDRDEQVLKDACLGLCQLFGEGIQNDRIQAILEANVVPKLVALLRPSKSRSVPISVQSAALQVLGNVACGDDRQTQVVIDSDALPCLRALLSSSDRGIRKEVCWIVSNITESSHQVQDVLDADILPPLLKLLDNQDTACREDATWVLFNLSSNRDPNQIAYLADKNGVRALCNLLACPKELDVLWKGCGTVAAVALKGLRNILISGHLTAASEPSGYNKMVSLVAESYGVERIDALTNHDSPDVRNRARLILERMFGTEPTNSEQSSITLASNASSMTTVASPPSPMGHAGCSCAFQHNQQSTQGSTHYHSNGLYDIGGNLASHTITSSHFAHSLGIEHSLPSHIQCDGDLIDATGSSSGSSTDSDPDDDDSDSDLIPPPPAPCACVLCTDSSPLVERRPRGKGADDSEACKHDGVGPEVRSICNFCSGGRRLGDGRVGLAAKLGRAVRLGHSHCLAVLLSRMTWSQRVAATEAPALLHPGGGPPDVGVGNSLPALILAAQLGKPKCLALLLRKCRPDLDVTHGKKRLTALAWAAHKSFMRCCQLLIEFGANTATKCGDGVTALHLAASGCGFPNICKLLIDHNAPVNARSSKKQTPLCLAAQKGSEKVLQLLLEHGADANNEDDNKYTPLHLAVLKGFEHCVDLLLKAGARVDTMTRKNITPLHYAVQGGFSAIVRSLISAGARVNCNNKPLLLIAADDGNVEVVQILLDAQAKIGCKASIRAMLDKGTEVTDCLTPLHLSASKAHLEVVELLLSRGANVNETTTKRKWTALDFAVLNGHAECAVTLLEHGALVSDNCKTIGRNNWTLVQYAAHHGAKDVVRLLIQRLQEQNTGSSHIPQDLKDEGPIESNSSTFRSLIGGEGLNEELQRRAHSGEKCVHNHLEDIHEYTPEKCLHHSGHSAGSSTSSTHRFDPRSLDGDEVGFGSGPGYGISGNVSRSTSKSRRRVVKEDRQSTMRKKRELEANDARERLEDAMNQRSVARLTEAIAHVSKLVLHLATNAGSGSNNGNHPSDSTDVNGYDPCSNDNHVHAPGSGPSKGSTSPYCSNGVSSSVAVELGLGIEVQKARKVLLGLLAEEKRTREEKEKEAADLKRENAQSSVKKAISNVLHGGDPRALTRAVTRATRTILDDDDSAIIEANTLSELVSNMEKRYAVVKDAERDRSLESLSGSLPKANELYVKLKDIGGGGALQRIFDGNEPREVLGEADTLLKQLQDKQERDIQEARRAMDLEKSTKQKLEKAIKSNDIVALENALEEASEALMAKNSVLGAALESGKKMLSKWVKGERRKLRQACNTNDPEVIENSVRTACKLGVKSLGSDINSAKAHALKLRDQFDAVRKLDFALSKSDVVSLSEIRERLTGLGMFVEAEKARAELERLQKSVRARTLLEGAIEDCKHSRDTVILALSQRDGSNDILEPLMSWPWPDLQRLSELSERAKMHGQSSHFLSNSADTLLKELAKIGRRVLGMCTKSNDARAIAAMIAGYEKSFMSVQKPEFIDQEGSEKAVSIAKERLAEVQAMDQASVKAESALVKVEYALATSRRAAERTRSGGGLSHSKASGTQCYLPSKIGIRNGAVRVEPQDSYASSDVDDNVSEIDAELHQLQCSETGSVRSVEGARPSVAKKCRAASYIGDDSETLELSSALAGECSHYYRFKEGSTVQCARCGHLRSSGNPEWLARVKRRGSNLPSELLSSSFGLASEFELGRMRSVANPTPDVVDLEPVDRNDLSFLRGGIDCEMKQVLPSAFVMNSSSISGGVSSLITNCDADVHTNLPMMIPMLTSQVSSQKGLKMNGAGRGRGRTQMSAEGLDTGLQGLGSNVYGSAVVGEEPGPVVVSSPIAAVYSGTPVSLGGGVAPGFSGQQNISAFGMSGLNSLEKTKGALHMGGDMGALNVCRMGVGDIMVANGSRAIEGMGMVGGVGPSECGNSGVDLGVMDFENENFGFDIDKIVDDNPLPGGDEVMGGGMDASGSNGSVINDVINRGPLDVASSVGNSSVGGAAGNGLAITKTGAGPSCIGQMKSSHERMFAH